MQGLPCTSVHNTLTPSNASFPTDWRRAGNYRHTLFIEAHEIGSKVCPKGSRYRIEQAAASLFGIGAFERRLKTFPGLKKHELLGRLLKALKISELSEI